MKKLLAAIGSGLLISGIAAFVYRSVQRSRAASAGSRQSDVTAPTVVNEDTVEQIADAMRTLGTVETRSDLLDLNTASLEDLAGIAGLGSEAAGRIVENRPYRNKLDLLSRMIVPEDVYQRIAHSITVAQPTEGVKIA